MLNIKTTLNNILKVLLLAAFWLSASLICIGCSLSYAKELPYSFTAKVEYVYDGDTIYAKDSTNNYHRIRLAYIDAPEKDQPYGIEATKILRSLVQDQTVLVSVLDIDKYGREVGNVYYGQPAGQVQWSISTDTSASGPVPVAHSASETMLKKGAAWHYSYFDKYNSFLNLHKELETEARLAPRGLWKDATAIPPWQWRKLHKNEN